MLHIIYSPEKLLLAGQFSQPDDEFLLIENAVYALLEAKDPQSELAQLLTLIENRLFVLEADIKARGLTTKIDPQLQQVDYAGFVDLTAKHTQSLTWK